MKPPSWRPGSICGVVLAAAGYVLSLTPSLLPRATLTQVLASALVAMTGYAIGATGEGLFIAVARHRALARGAARIPDPTAPWRAWKWWLAGVALVAAAACTPFGMRAQTAQFAATGAPGQAPNWLAVAAGTLAGCLALLGVGRSLRALGRAIARWITRRSRIGQPVALLLGGLGAALTVTGVVALAVALSYPVFGHLNNSVPAGQTRPTSSLRSGGPQSLVSWSSLGVQGRWFVQGGPAPAQIAAVTRLPALEPIRAYAGVESAGTNAERARLAVADLIRAGGLKRKAIMVYTTATDGLVDPTAAAAAEYIQNGDVASVSMQYTVLPSFMSMILNQDDALDAGRALLAAVRAEVRELPAGDRPKVYVYGESLGAFGSMAPFADGGVAGLVAQADGAVWAGPPFNSSFWKQLNSIADGGPAWQPIVGNGAVVRYAADAAGLRVPDAPWGPVRAVFLQNATDPVTWFAPALAVTPPGWLDGPRGPGVPGGMRWVPIVTFEQVALDLPAAGSMPPGVGHNYRPDIAPALVAILQPPNWTPQIEARLQAAL